MPEGISRRDFLFLAVAGRVTAPEWVRYPDPATELEVFRLTDPQFSSGMVPPHLRQFTRHGEFLLYWSDRSGTRQAYLLDLKEGDSRQVTDAETLDPKCLTLSPEDRNILFIDGASLKEAPLLTIKPREIHRAADGTRLAWLNTGSDGTIYFAEIKNGRSRVIRIARQQTRAIAELEGELESLEVRPRRTQLLYRLRGSLWLMSSEGTSRRQIRVQDGQTGAAIWTPSGRTLIYLHTPDNPKELITAREFSPDDNTDKLLAKTSQFISIAPNADGSVFSGASRSKGSAYVLILLRAARREMTLCEHHASDPAMVNPVFSPDSQSVFFVSDRHGQPAVYRVPVAKFVEETETEAPLNPR